MSPGHEQSKHPVSAALAGPYGHPFHPILVTIPIGSWVASLAFDVASQLGFQPTQARFAALWLIAIGVLGALAASSIGVLDLLALPTHTRVRRTAVKHATLNVAVILAYAANFTWRYDAGETNLATGWGPVMLSVLSLVGLTVSGSLGGKLAYRYGVRVAAETFQADGFEPGPPYRSRSGGSLDHPRTETIRRS